ncbi:MAG: ABC transporter permease [Bacilli bacterium]|nr:ABC transporter permease [Bacilli bacterium]MBN2695983.1 ABC transporter permease [Bacilli bacterium]
MKKISTLFRDFRHTLSSWGHTLTHNRVLNFTEDKVGIFGKFVRRKQFFTVLSIVVFILAYILLWVFGKDTIYNILRRSTYIIIPLALVAFGGLYAERSGVTNIALEGIMIFGALIGFLFIYFTEDSQINSQLVYVIAIIIAGISGMLFSSIHAFASINMKANQIISGTALNLLAPSFALFLIYILFGGEDIVFRDRFFVQEMGFLSDIPVIGPILFTKAYMSTFYVLVVIVVMSIIMYKTRFGLRLRACGEHPHAADAAGINVVKMRYAGVLISGFLAGMGGIVLVVPLDVAYRATASGYGFLALAVLISGQWKPVRIFVIAAFFGFMLNLSAAYTSIPFLLNAGLPDKMYSMIPFIFTLIILAMTSKKSRAPKAVGEPYDPGKR